jgi:DNA replication protein DnaC
MSKTTTEKPQLLLKHHLKQLKLPTFLAEHEKQAHECAQGGVDHVRYLLRLAELELIERERRMVDRRIRAAKFPVVKGLDSFDFTAIPSLNKMLPTELARAANTSCAARTSSRWGIAAPARAMSRWLWALPPVSAASRSGSPRRPGLSIS